MRHREAQEAFDLRTTHRDSPDGSYARIYRQVNRVPAGRVATYGQIARLAGLPGHARQVGYALHALSDGSRVPWYRVLNSRGAISLRRGSDGHVLQRRFLEKEGVRFDPQGRVDLARFGWKPRVRRPRP